MAASALNGNVKMLGAIILALVSVLGGGYAAHADMVGEVAALKEKVSAHKDAIKGVKDEIKSVREEIVKQAEKDRKAIWALKGEISELTKELAIESASHRIGGRSRR